MFAHVQCTCSIASDANRSSPFPYDARPNVPRPYELRGPAQTTTRRR